VVRVRLGSERARARHRWSLRDCRVLGPIAWDHLDANPGHPTPNKPSGTRAFDFMDRVRPDPGDRGRSDDLSEQVAARSRIPDRRRRSRRHVLGDRGHCPSSESEEHQVGEMIGEVRTMRARGKY